ncbi:hypothetical protein ACH5RR_008290 [Cinchona calisaya]|uniref:Aminotransferase-like plant mobile domain-containing protein n=1 Tax=Cinchona calisaya TaxID=153742 RepID=A0ABD3ACU9_9GENT
MLENYTTILEQAGIYGAITVACYSYNICAEVSKAFLELWSPLTNTLHFVGRKMGISLLDMKMICGLPIIGIPYEKFILSNHQLQVTNKEGKRLHPTTVSKFLLTHTKLCILFNVSKVLRSKWIDYFHRDRIIFGAFGEITSPMHPYMKKRFSRYLSKLLRKQLWELLSLFGLVGDPDIAIASFPIHLLVEWSGEHFSALYRHRSEQHVEYYSNPLEYSKDMEFLDTDELSLDNFEFLLSIHNVLSSNEPVYVIIEIKEIPAGSFKGAVKLVDCGNTTDPNSTNSVDAQKGSNLSNATFFQGGKKVKIKGRRLLSRGSDEKNFKRTRRYKGLSPESSPETEFTTSFTDLITKLQTFDLDENISSQEKFVKDIDREGVEILSYKLSDHLKSLKDLNSQLQDFRERLQELENQKTVIQKEKARIEIEMLQVEDKCGVLTSGIVDLEKSLEQGENDEQLIRIEIYEVGKKKIRALEDLKK